MLPQEFNFTPEVPPAYTCNVATPADLADILELYRTLDDAGKLGLLVFPEPYRSRFIAAALEKQRIYIARADATHQLMGMVKLFVVEDTDELAKIMYDELRIDRTERRLPEALLAGDRGRYCYVYYGGVYTVSRYRGCGINTALTCYALEQQAGKFAAVPDGVVLLYGQVQANITQFGMVRCLTQVLGSAGMHYYYPTYKPDFYLDAAGALTMQHDHEDRAGRGNLVFFVYGGASC